MPCSCPAHACRWRMHSRSCTVRYCTRRASSCISTGPHTAHTVLVLVLTYCRQQLARGSSSPSWHPRPAYRTVISPSYHQRSRRTVRYRTIASSAPHPAALLAPHHRQRAGGSSEGPGRGGSAQQRANARSRAQGKPRPARAGSSPSKLGSAQLGHSQSEHFAVLTVPG